MEASPPQGPSQLGRPPFAPIITFPNPGDYGPLRPPMNNVGPAMSFRGERPRPSRNGTAAQHLHSQQYSLPLPQHQPPFGAWQNYPHMYQAPQFVRPPEMPYFPVTAAPPFAHSGLSQQCPAPLAPPHSNFVPQFPAPPGFLQQRTPDLAVSPHKVRSSFTGNGNFQGPRQVSTEAGTGSPRLSSFQQYVGHSFTPRTQPRWSSEPAAKDVQPQEEVRAVKRDVKVEQYYIEQVEALHNQLAERDAEIIELKSKQPPETIESARSQTSVEDSLTAGTSSPSSGSQSYQSLPTSPLQRLPSSLGSILGDKGLSNSTEKDSKCSTSHRYAEKEREDSQSSSTSDCGSTLQGTRCSPSPVTASRTDNASSKESQPEECKIATESETTVTQTLSTLDKDQSDSQSPAHMEAISEYSTNLQNSASRYSQSHGRELGLAFKEAYSQHVLRSSRGSKHHVNAIAVSNGSSYIQNSAAKEHADCEYAHQEVLPQSTPHTKEFEIEEDIPEWWNPEQSDNTAPVISEETAGDSGPAGFFGNHSMGSNRVSAKSERVTGPSSEANNGDCSGPVSSSRGLEQSVHTSVIEDKVSIMALKDQDASVSKVSGIDKRIADLRDEASSQGSFDTKVFQSADSESVDMDSFKTLSQSSNLSRTVKSSVRIPQNGPKVLERHVEPKVWSAPTDIHLDEVLAESAHTSGVGEHPLGIISAGNSGTAQRLMRRGYKVSDKYDRSMAKFAAMPEFEPMGQSGKNQPQDLEAHK